MTKQEPNQFKSTTIPVGDEGDVVCPERMYIYIILGVKVGSTNSIKERARKLGYPPEALIVLLIVPAGCMTLNGIQHMEDIEGWKHGFTPDHNGQRMSANRARLGNNGIGVGRSYVLTNVATGACFTVRYAARFERANKLYGGAISSVANPKRRDKSVTVNGVKHTVAYADQQKGGE
jgi:hypothetical protein|tara:strand:- start:2120 stop:2650 length:531 start_codon:yes stop_codon:yes gene_type:complete